MRSFFVPIFKFCFVEDLKNKFFLIHNIMFLNRLTKLRYMKEFLTF